MAVRPPPQSTTCTGVGAGGSFTIGHMEALFPPNLIPKKRPRYTPWPLLMTIPLSVELPSQVVSDATSTHLEAINLVCGDVQQRTSRNLA